MSTEQNYVGRDSHATPNVPLCRGHLYRTQIYLLVVATARLSGLPESQVWKNVYARLTSHYGIYLDAYPRRHKESLLRVAERFDLLDKVHLSAQAEKLLCQ